MAGSAASEALLQRAIKNSEGIYRRNCRPGDRVLIALDTGVEHTVREVLSRAAEAQGVSYEVLTSSPAPGPNSEPDPTVAAALGQYQLVLLANSVPISHTEAVRKAVEKGSRFVMMDGLDLDMLSAGAASADYEEVHRRGVILERLWNQSKHVRVTSEFGTELEADITGRESWRFDGTVFEAPWFLITGTAFPDGEVGIAPLEGSAQGVIVWDASVHSLGLLREPVRLTIKDGWIRRIEGGEQAKQFEVYLESLDDPKSYYVPAEIAIGINEAARVRGTMREDKKVLGGVHIACGTNVDLGGSITAKIHIDGLIRHPSLWMDGKQIIDRGRILPEVVA